MNGRADCYHCGEPVPDGPSKGEIVHLKRLLDDYYAVMGWDPEGVPTAAKLQELGLNISDYA